MPSRRPHWIEEAADRLREEMLASAEAVAERLAPPADAFDGSDVSRREAIAIAREESLRDPGYMLKDLNQMAPAAIPLPDGRTLRAETGLKNFIAKWKEARPDIFAAVSLTDTSTLPPVQSPAPPMPAQPPAPPAPAAPMPGPPPVPPGGV